MSVTRVKSPGLGRIEVVRDGAGIRIRAHGVLYAMHARRLSRTATPWLLLASVPWILPGGRTERRGGAARIGLLGFGAGTVARLIANAGLPVEIVGVEPDPAMRALAAKAPGSRGTNARVVAADACDYLRAAGPRFDVLLDDIFAPDGGELSRPAGVTRLAALAKKRLYPGGIYAVNLSSPGGARERDTLAHVRASFRHVKVAYTRDYAHRIVIASDRDIPRGRVQRSLGVTLRIPGVSANRLGLSSVRRLS